MASSALHWNFSQVFGERNPADDVQPMDVISAIEFEDSGDHLAVGDQGGRLIIFEKTPGDKWLFSSERIGAIRSQ